MRSTKLTPLTTRPSFTSRQGMMRVLSMGQPTVGASGMSRKMADILNSTSRRPSEIEASRPTISSASTGHVPSGRRFQTHTRGSSWLHTRYVCNDAIAVYSRCLVVRSSAVLDGESTSTTVSYTHLRAHETDSYLVCR